MAQLESAQHLIDEFRKSGTKLIMNVAIDAVGHVIAELDNFLRMQRLREFTGNETALLSADFDNRLQATRKLFGDLICDFWDLGEHQGFLARVIANAAPDLAVDVGISSFKYAVPEHLRTPHVAWVQSSSQYRETSGAWLRTGHDEYYRRRSLTPDYFPFVGQLEKSDRLEEFIGARGGKVAAVQIKTNIASGSAALTDPATYEPGLALLKDQGYALVFVGREVMPESWKRFGLVDYGNSKLASFENDYRLFDRVDFGFVGPSGISQFLELFDKPYAYVNTSLTHFPPYSRRAVYNPAIIQLPDGRFVPFAEQQAMSGRHPSWSFVHATADQITACVREALERITDPDRSPTPLQQRYKALGPVGSCTYSRAVVCDRFLSDWEHLLPA